MTTQKGKHRTLSRWAPCEDLQTV
ncbi:hypothetical protein GH733_000922 [Mirounga leonina]|nr:hypothetical protein GH733_000922 [Mirounga leonina]